MGKDKPEQEFENYMEGDSALSRDYRNTSSEQPPEHLDDAILAASRRQVKTRPRSVISPFSSNWHVPLSIAAVLVLSVTVVVTMQQQYDDVYLQVPAGDKPGVAGKSIEGGFPSASQEAEALQSKDRADLYEEDFPVDLDRVFVSEPTAPLPMATMRQKPGSTGVTRKKIIQKEMSLPAMRTREAVSEESVMAMPAEDSYAPGPAGTPEEYKYEPTSDLNELETGKESLLQDSNPTRAVILEKRDHGISKNKAGRMRSEKRFASEQMSEDATDRSMDMSGELQRSAEQWLVRIRQLWLNGHEEEAAHELQLFYQRYPDYQEDKLIKRLDRRLLDTLNID